MFALLPIKTDCPPKRRPLVNYAIIGLNVLIFLAMHYGSPEFADRMSQLYSLDGANPKLYQFITYAFLHAGWGHLIGNMLFLYIFGNSLNDKLGHIEYLLFYLAGAIVAGAGYSIFTHAPLVGASGAIAAVTTGFLVLFPRSNILVLIWIFYFIDTFEFSSLFLIGFKMILWDNIIGPKFDGPSNVAHGAHLIGYAFGFVVPLILLAVRALDRDQFDIIALASRIFRRHQFATTVYTSGDPFSPKLQSSGPVGNSTATVEPEAAVLYPPKIVELRQNIADAIARFDLHTAAECYRALIAEDKDHILSRKAQLDVANQLMSEQDYPAASDAYEKYLRRYPNAEQTEQVLLLLGIISGRYLVNADRARELLHKAQPLLKDANQIALCEQEIRRLENL
jgi:membrane associated rhomboid family serine protease